ncbi:GNAT family N-acetyltransferase [Clostridium tarantellae]|uniref:GNAT family N-acetyltransferase n=1 Tax=Clostridium tarantellae TaxID=39493 RepID=A0A6I1MR18_9CLOT|nr:GNAT family N-acetyltransferase [Clostridium tarantellae]MPQ44617.1 GNAT family N-acetyltransferase [Clostridium tarantellae]
MEVKIKAFNELSVYELYEIVKSRFEVFIMEQKIICEQDLDNLDTLCYHSFICKNNRVVAYARIIPKGLSYEQVAIGRVLVLKDYRRKGLAKQILKDSIEFVKNKLKEQSLILSAQIYTMNLYENIGFKPLGEIYDEVGIPHIKMILNN